VIRGLIGSISQHYITLLALCEASVAVQMGLCERQSVLNHLEIIARKQAMEYLPSLQRLIAFELWAQGSNVPVH